nr:immunoglobulin light chain junction region [Macaca mulatta]MOW57860.1 immunoglobulin light chain junction region [Macaca mulatta]
DYYCALYMGSGIVLF